APDAAAIQKLIDQLGSDDPAVRKTATDRLMEIGDPAIAPLRATAAKPGDPDLRLRAAVLARAVEQKGLGEIRKLESHKDIVWCVALAPDGKTALSAGGDQYDNGNWAKGTDFDIRVWDALAGKELRLLKGHTSGVTCVAFSPDGKQAISGGGDNI